MSTIGIKCHKHTEGHIIINNHNGAQPEDCDLINSGNKGVHPSKHHIKAGLFNTGVAGFDINIEPVLGAPLFKIERFDGRDTVQRLHKVGAGSRSLNNLLFCHATIEMISCQAHNRIAQGKTNDHPC